MNRLAALWLATIAVIADVDAQTVWRCGPDGRVYSDRPCADGGRAVEVADPRSPEQLRAAQEIAARDRQLADRMAGQRRQRELAALPGLAPVSSRTATARPPRPAAGDRLRSLARPPKSTRPRPADDGTFRAVAPSSRRTKD